MEARMNIENLEPEGFERLLSVEGYLTNSGLDSKFRNLIKLKVSLLNACVYCVKLHTAAARRQGETESRLDALGIWRQSLLFTDKEKALLSVIEEVTFIADYRLTEETFQNAKKYFSDQLIMQAIIQIAMTNAWNRIAISSRAVHPTKGKTKFREPKA